MIWSFLNQKGGVGKTTSVLGVASALLKHSLNILLIDLDPQGSLSFFFDSHQEKINSSFIFEEKEVNTLDLIHKTKFSNLNIIPASKSLYVTNEKIENGWQLSHFLKETPLLQNYDHILIDTPAGMNRLVVNSIVASDFITVPVFMDSFSYEATVSAMQSVERIIGQSNPQAQFLIFPSLFDPRTKIGKIFMQRCHQQFGDNCWKEWIPAETKLKEAMFHKKMMHEVEGPLKAALAFDRLVKAVLRQHSHNLMEQYAVFPLSE